MKVRIKKLNEKAVVPTKAHADDAGFDLVAISRVFDKDGNVVYGTGLAFEIPKGYVGLLFPRSSCVKKDLALGNAVGVIDSGYRGEVTFKFKPALFFAADGEPRDGEQEGWNPYPVRCYEIGERIGQLIIMPYPEVEFEEVSELSETERGAGGYGSTGK